MRTTEGVGLVAPRPVPVPITVGDRQWALRIATERAEYRRYAYRSDAWGLGLLGDDPRNAIYTGLIGELAFARWSTRFMPTEILVDTAPRMGGDGGIDFTLCGYGVQVKTAATDYDELLVRSDHLSSADWDIIVRVHYPPRRVLTHNGLFGPEHYRDRTRAELCGWAWRMHFQRFATLQTARRGDHMNQVLASQRFQHMDYLRDLLVSKIIGGVS